MVFGDLEWCKDDVKKRKYELKILRGEQRILRKRLKELTETIGYRKEELEGAISFLESEKERSKK